MTERSEELSSLRETFVDRVIVPRFQEYRSNGQIIDDPLVFEAFRSVDRGLFAPRGTIYDIYADSIIPLQDKDRSTISQPGLLALMMHGLQLNGSGKVLEIGTASGYGAALLSRCADEVHTIESNPDLAQLSRELLGILGYQNVTVHTGDGLVGVAEAAPFDRIIVTAGVRKIPRALIDQLAEGGIIIAPVGYRHPRNQDIIQGIKRGGKLRSKLFIGDVAFVPAISGESGGWMQETYERAKNKGFRRMQASKKPILQPFNVKPSQEDVENAKRKLNELTLISPVSRQIDERIDYLMDQGLTHDQLMEDHELRRLQETVRQLLAKPNDF